MQISGFGQRPELLTSIGEGSGSDSASRSACSIVLTSAISAPTASDLSSEQSEPSSVHAVQPLHSTFSGCWTQTGRNAQRCGGGFRASIWVFDQRSKAGRAETVISSTSLTSLDHSPCVPFTIAAVTSKIVVVENSILVELTSLFSGMNFWI